MRQRRLRKVTPFVALRRHARKELYTKAKNLIRRSASVLGGKFYTPDYLHGENSWIDAYFLGRHAPTFYNLTLETTRCRYRALVESKALDLSYETAPEQELSVLERAEKDPRTGNWVTPAYQPLQYSEFGGKTRYQWIEERQSEIAEERREEVFEEWELDFDYAFGIGLHATIHVPYLTIAAINAFIDRFLEQEEGFRDPKPHTFSYQDAGCWGVDSNAIIEPWEWQAAKADADREASSESSSETCSEDAHRH